MLKMIKISVIAASVVLAVTGCSTKEDLKAVAETQFFYTTHHCPVYSGDSVCPMPKVQALEIVDGDDDADGVLNSVDKCPGTVPYQKVDASGCKVASVAVDGDSDKDGVKDSMDKCPGTNSNVTKVDADGCAAEVNLSVNFEFNSSTVKENSLADILSFGYFMNEHTSYKANIEGHTDSSGPAEYNQMLSQKRAQAVADLIVSKANVDASRVQAIGKGESTPVADNATKAGRSENRRTEAHIIK